LVTIPKIKTSLQSDFLSDDGAAIGRRGARLEDRGLHVRASEAGRPLWDGNPSIVVGRLPHTRDTAATLAPRLGSGFLTSSQYSTPPSPPTISISPSGVCLHRFMTQKHTESRIHTSSCTRRRSEVEDVLEWSGP
jgi:hypothetical protein